MLSSLKEAIRKAALMLPATGSPISSKNESLPILCIHGVTKTRRLCKTANFERRHIHKDRFREVIRYIRRYFSPINLAQLDGYYYAGKPLPKNPALVTLDDGFANNYYHAFPVLREYDCPATIFLATGYIGNKREYWVEKLEYSIYKTAREMLKVSILGKEFILPLKAMNEKEFAYMAVLKYLKGGFNFSKVDEATRCICDYLGFPSPAISEDSEDYCFLTWEQIKEMQKSKISFGAHTINHVNLAFEDMSTAETEVQGSKLAIERELGVECSAFCYPFGRSGYSEALEGLLKRTGYKFSFQLGGDLNYKDTNPLLLSRICLAWGMNGKDLTRHIVKKTREDNVRHKT
jgi:peptidoglycan/xylan/chitin deacetylase (PgdA/CDA1 family)